ncbi:hypothetical protein [Gluconobacter japonicus]|uniref:Uncharacterized protein n=1 Tax=Gluconobacter japonicus TaxID=376620 RepID=A0A9Q2IS16_GLUJA|nr:hypothetical protein [Gluconobacter japonicus]MBF0869714.1 hypothetical protein [Gluconobacter japonicus]
MTTALDAIKAAYPARYYATTDGSVVTGVLDVWAGTTNNVQAQINVLALPAVSDLIALTADQFAETVGATNIPVSGGALVYASRYAAKFDHTAAQPAAVTGWYDLWTLGSHKNLPALDDLLLLSAADWQALGGDYSDKGNKGVQDGQLIDYTPPPVPVPLPDQAKSEQAWIQYQVNLAAAMGEAFTDPMKAYVKAIAAIADGTDTTSTALPARPDPIMA